MTSRCLVATFIVLIVVATIVLEADSFVVPQQRHDVTLTEKWMARTTAKSVVLFATEKEGGEKDKVQVGSREYMDGFLSSPIQDNSGTERGDGVEQAIKLGGSVAAILTLLFFGFMGSNGLI
mmetsp:Transcript_19230/g.24769  ORF Transcript_19230/g.24769 Transcript_19230/m.24769 type:complete len:122 (+) Transcript_19230:174-539(+)